MTPLAFGYSSTAAFPHVSTHIFIVFRAGSLLYIFSYLVSLHVFQWLYCPLYTGCCMKVRQTRYKFDLTFFAKFFKCSANGCGRVTFPYDFWHIILSQIVLQEKNRIFEGCFGIIAKLGH